LRLISFWLSTVARCVRPTFAAHDLDTSTRVSFVPAVCRPRSYPLGGADSRALHGVLLALEDPYVICAESRWALSSPRDPYGSNLWHLCRLLQLRRVCARVFRVEHSIARRPPRLRSALSHVTGVKRRSPRYLPSTRTIAHVPDDAPLPLRGDSPVSNAR